MPGTAYKQMNLWNRVMDRQARAEAIRSPWDGLRSQIVELYRPDLTATVDAKGQPYTSSTVLNGDPAYCAMVMSRGILSGMMNAARPWRAYKPKEDFLQDDNDIREWCQRLDAIMLDVYADRDSTFYQAISRYNLSSITVGSPVLIVEEHNGHIVYTVPHHKQYWIFRDYFGEVIGLHLKYKLAAMEIEQDYPESEHLFPMNLKQAMQSGGHFDEYDVLQAFYRTNDAIFKDRPVGDVEILRHRPWLCLWQLTGTDADKQEPLRFRYYRSRPFVVGDWDLNPQETYSRTPACHALADALGGQSIWKSQLQLAELKARPPIWSLKRLKASLDRKPGGVTAVEERDWEKRPIAFGYEGDYLTSKDMWERVNKANERWFFVGFFLQWTALVERGQAPPTATQVLDMGAEKLEQLSGGIQGIENKTLWPIDDRIFEILYYAGALPRPPDRFMQEASGVLIPVFQGPLSQAQRLNAMLRRVNTGLAACSALFTLDETAALKLKIPDMVERIMEEVGVWEDTLRSKDEYEEIVQQMIDRQEQQARIVMGKAQAETMSKMQGKTDPTSPLAQMVGR